MATKRRKRKAQPQSRVPPWLWLATGTLLGSLVMFLLQLTKLEPEESRKLQNKTILASNELKETRFEFYNLLRDSEVVVPELKDTFKPKPRENVEYHLQVASFRQLADAEQTRAELVLLNLDARIEKADSSRGETWHRILIGPFKSRSQLAKARSTLLSNRYEAMLLTRKPGQK